ncbi:Fic family protein [Emticicia sp. ODNR4P]|nr:Fic family protein [Emticicia sp. ODNR4P]
MITLDKTLLSPDLLQRIENLNIEINNFRREGELDQLSKEKLKEYFRTQHIFHSAGIEGNRLTLQETMLVLREGITISEKSIQDTVEVKNLGTAFDYFYELAQESMPITENDIKQIHQLVVGNDTYVNAGNYRNVGVIITGSEHTPPEPFEVPFKMQELIDWLNENFSQENPIILAAVAHHEMAKIHPFADGNGRTARLLLNLILMKQGYPICSIKRTERPRYYEAMAEADKGNYHPIVELVAENCAELFAVYVRIREESNRKTQFAKKWGSRDIEGRLRKEKSRFELWLNRMNQIKLEFRQFTDLLNESLETYSVSYYEYPLITFDTFQELEDKGSAQNTFFFSIRFIDRESKKIVQTFVFRFFRDHNKFSIGDTFIPLELNCYNPQTKNFLVIDKFQWKDRVQLRCFYFNSINDLIIVRYDRTQRKTKEDSNLKLHEIVETFFNDVLSNVLGL